MIDAELLAWVAAGLTLIGSSRREMVPLRLVLMASNLCWVVFGLIGGFYPLVVLHALLFPCHLARLIEQRRQSGSGTATGEAAKVDRSARDPASPEMQEQHPVYILLPGADPAPAGAALRPAAPGCPISPFVEREEDQA